MFDTGEETLHNRLSVNQQYMSNGDSAYERGIGAHGAGRYTYGAIEGM